MRDLSRSLQVSGTSVPVPWSGLGYYLKPRTGNLMAVAAAAGVGKSMFSLLWCLAIGVPCLYVSLDQTLVDHSVRLIANMRRMTVDEVMEGHQEDPKAWASHWGPWLEDQRFPVRFADHTNTVKEVDEVVLAETEYWGHAPLITVVDNVADLLEDEESASSYQAVFQGLRKIAAQRNTMVMALHHLRRKPAKFGQRERDQGTQPVMKTDILYAGDRSVQYLLALWRPRQDELAVGVLKNRMGPADASSNINQRLRADFARATLTQDGMAGFQAAATGTNVVSLDAERRRRWDEGG